MRASSSSVAAVIIYSVATSFASSADDRPVRLGLPGEGSLHVAIPGKGDDVVYCSRLLQIGVVSLNKGTHSKMVDLNGSAAACAAFSSDGKYWLSGAGGVVQIRDPQTGKVQSQFEPQTGDVYSVRTDKSGTRVIVVTWKGVEVHNLKNRSVECAINYIATFAAVTSDEKTFLTATDDGVLAKWDVKSSKRIMTTEIKMGKPEGVTDLALSQDDKTAFVALRDGRVCVVDTQSMKSRDLVDLATTVSVIKCSQDGKYIAVGTLSGTLSIIDLKTEKVVVKNFKLSAEPASFAFTSDSKQLAIGLMNESCALYSLADNRIVWAVTHKPK